MRSMRMMRVVRVVRVMFMRPVRVVRVVRMICNNERDGTTVCREFRATRKIEKASEMSRARGEQLVACQTTIDGKRRDRVGSVAGSGKRCGFVLHVLGIVQMYVRG